MDESLWLAAENIERERDWPLMDTPVRRQVAVGLMEKLEANLA